MGSGLDLSILDPVYSICVNTTILCLGLLEKVISGTVHRNRSKRAPKWR